MPGIQPTFFQRFLLPGFAFKAVVVGGGYATGRELVEFFLPSGPWGGILGMFVAAAVWSVICSITFLFARQTHSHDYRQFFRNLLGPLWFVFDAAYLLLIVIVLSVFAAAAGALGGASLGWPPIAGALCLATCIAAVTTYGNEAVERLFKYVSFFLYGVYAVFLFLCLSKFGERILDRLAIVVPESDWMSAGVAYASYSVVGATVILPVVRHLTSRRDAVIAGLLCGPLAMVPAMLFFVCMAAFYPQIATEELPANFLLEQLRMPVFQLIFQLMIFSALLESGAGCVHAVNQRIASTWAERGRELHKGLRFSSVAILLAIAIFIAHRFGLVALIAQGYRALSYLFLAVFIAPLLTFGVWQLWTSRSRQPAATVLPFRQTVE